jgi:hypothetical protein
VILYLQFCVVAQVAHKELFSQIGEIQNMKTQKS